MKKLLYLLTLALFVAACRQNDQPANILSVQTFEPEKTAIRVSPPDADAAEPTVAADTDGNIYVLYVEHRANKAGDLYLQKFDARMNLLGKRTRVNPQSGEATAWSGDAPTIIAGANQTVFVGWTKRVENAAGNGTDLCLSISRDGGKTFAAPVKVNDDILPASHGMHSLAIGGDGAIYMVWLDERNVKSAPRAENYSEDNADFRFIKVHHNDNRGGDNNSKTQSSGEKVEPNSEVFFAASFDGGRTFAPNLKLASDVCPCCKTNLTVAPDGRIYASWRQVLSGDFRHIAVASSADAGKTFSAPAVVSDDRWQIAICPVSGAPMNVGKDNQLKIVWFTAGKAGTPGLYEAESNDFGKTFSKRILISENIISGTPILTLDTAGERRIVWEADGRIYQSKLAENRQFTEPQTIGDGNFPAAISVEKKLFVAFVKKDDERRVVWLNAL